MDRELDLRLKEIRGRITQVDPLLARLVRVVLGFGGTFQYGLVLILDGVTVKGIPAPSISTGEALDKQSIRYLRAMQAIDMSSGGSGKGWSETIGWYEEASIFHKLAESQDEAENKVLKKIGDAKISDLAELLDWPEEFADEAVLAFLPPKAFTLINAQIRPTNGRDWESVPNMRVNLSSVRAWWTFDLGIPEEAQEILAKLEEDAEG